MKCPACGHDPAALTPRQLDVARGLVRGQETKIIARELGISVDTVKSYCWILYSKLGVVNRTQAAMEVVRLGLVPLPNGDAE